MILRCGVGNKRRLLADATVTEMTVPRPIPGGQLRSYAFDVATEHSNAWSCSYAKGVTFGHTGFTGTMLWINPRDNCFLVLLTNAVHTSSHNAVRTLRARIINWVLNSKI
jgi:CubicO group peptidase (beta-lactamase class C family)